MICKPKLLLHPDKWSNAVVPYLEHLFDEYFERVFIDPSETYDPKASIVYTHCLDTHWVIDWRDNGYQVAVDNLWEVPWPNRPDSVFTIMPSPWFFRANESLCYEYLGYHQYTRMPNITKTFLMLMNDKRLHRDQIYEQIDLDNSLHSYIGRGVLLNHNDIDITDHAWQRYSNPDWYNITNFSMIVESVTFSEPLGPTEKTYKPIAFEHPFMLWGPAGYLKQLHQQGFQTFDHIIDESYDNEQDHSVRLSKIIDQVNMLKNIELTDEETVKRTRHNHSLFFDTAWSKQQFDKNLFQPLLELL